MRFIDAREIRNLLTFPILLAGLEDAHRRPKIEVQDGCLGSENAQYFVRNAVDRGRFKASKLITRFAATSTISFPPPSRAGGRRPISRYLKNAAGGHLDLMTAEMAFHQLGAKDLP